jgi:chromosome segregation ATPase
MPFHDPTSQHLSNLLSSCRTAAVVAGDLEGAGGVVKQLQAQIASITSQISLAQKSLAAEKAEFAEWRRKQKDEKDLGDTGDELELRGLTREIEAQRTALWEIHNQLAKGRDEVERLAMASRRLERLIQNPPRAPSQ